MATTRSYRLNRLELQQELLRSAMRAEWNRIAVEVAYRDRDAAGVAPVAPAELMGLFWSADLADHQIAWLVLALMTPAQRTNMAIEVACWLEGQDRAISWGAILDKWTARLAELVEG